MHIRTLRIQNFRSITDMSLRFDDSFGNIRPITVLAGPNGCGKTSVLFAIVQALRGPVGYRTEDVPFPSDLDIHQKANGTGLLSAPVSVSVAMDIEFDEDEQEAIPQVYEDTTELHPLEPHLAKLEGGKGRLSWKFPPAKNPDGSAKPVWYVANTSPPPLLSWLRGRRYAIRGWLGRKLRDRTLLERVGGLCLFPQDRNLRSRVVGSPQTGPRQRPSLDGEDAGDDSSPVAVSGPRPVTDILAYLAEYVRAREETLPDQQNWEQKVKEWFKLVCAPKEYHGYFYQSNDPAGGPYLKEGSATYPLEQASSGEQVILEYVTRLTYPSPINHSLVLIDEPEIHLHPAWIRQLYRALPRLGVRNQYILTTHSPELRALAAEDNALVDLGRLEGE